MLIFLFNKKALSRIMKWNFAVRIQTAKYQQLISGMHVRTKDLAICKLKH